MSTPCKTDDKAPSHPNGYVKVWRDGLSEWRHIVTWTDAHGPVPRGLEVHHTCQNPGCFELSHLVAITPKENKRFAMGWTLREGMWYCKNGHLMEGWNCQPQKFGIRCRTCQNRLVAESKKRKRDNL